MLDVRLPNLPLHTLLTSVRTSSTGKSPCSFVVRGLGDEDDNESDDEGRYDGRHVSREENRRPSREVKIGVATEVVRPKESGLGTTSAGVVPEARRNTTTGATTAAQVLQICKLCLVAAMRNISEMIMIGRAQAVLVAVIVQAAAAGSSR